MTGGETTDHPRPQVPPLQARLLLHHAAVQHVADEAGIPLLHFKGPIAQQQFPHAHLRLSTDVDVLVPPEDMDRLVGDLLHAGWVLDESDLPYSWSHSRVLVHPVWGCTVDLHSHYPGIHRGAPEVFAQLAAGSLPVELGGRGCRAPEPVRHALLLLLHAARANSAKGPDDVAAVRRVLTPAQMAELVELTGRLRCRPAISAVLPDVVEDGSLAAAVWRAVSRHPHDGTLRWATRLLEAADGRQRRDVIASALRRGGPGRLRRGLAQVPVLARTAVRRTRG